MRSVRLGGGRHTATPAGDLRAAARSGHLVSVACTPKGPAPVEGLVVLVGLRWAVVHRLHPDLVFDGYVAVPTLQVSRVVDLVSRDWRAVEVAGLVREGGSAGVPHVDPTTTTTLLRSVAAGYGVLSVVAGRRGGARAITGEVERMVGRQLVFAPLRTGATVESCPLELVAIPEVGQIVFGTRVTTALARARGHRRPSDLTVSELREVESSTRRPDRPDRPTAVA
ncbi:MAG TPA: hypothetical protein VMT43_09225 [Acidimicrobiales bacterium]|nr:hypothetical protein [Acidimicrobiales bacterium]